jgi:hypothetical protein
MLCFFLLGLVKYDFIVFSVALVNVIVTPSFKGENQMYNSDPGSSYTHVIRIPKTVQTT